MIIKFLPGFYSDGPISAIEYARSLIEREYVANDRPWLLGYSGGKDSTLLLQLVCEVAQKNDFKKPLFVQFNNTRLEKRGKMERIMRERERIEKIPNVVFKITEPRPKERILVMIIGQGYPAPSPFERYCTNRMKQYGSERFESTILKKFGGVDIVLGVRKEESTNRAKYLTEDKAPSELKKKGNRFYFRPIADVLTRELWAYLNGFSVFFWGEPLSELKELYPGETVRQRDGCWICTVGTETGRTQNEPEDRIRLFLRVLNADKEKRTPESEKQKRRYAQGLSAGRFTLEARREFLAFIQKEERECGRRFIDDEELELIYSYWKEEEKNKEGETK